MTVTGFGRDYVELGLNVSKGGSVFCNAFISGSSVDTGGLTYISEIRAGNNQFYAQVAEEDAGTIVNFNIRSLLTGENP